MTQSIEGQDRDLKEWARSKISNVTTQLNGLREFVKPVEQFVHKKLPSLENGASGLGYRPSQGNTRTTASTRMTQATSSTAASSSAAMAPTPIPAQEYRLGATPSTPTSAAVFSTIQSACRAGAIRVETVILISGHLEM